MADIYLDYQDPGWSNAFTQPNSLYYLRYLALNFGLGGLFRPMTPWQIITGYTDQVLYQMSQFPIFMGGDQTLNPHLSIDNNPVTKPADASITFLTGETDAAQTRQVSSWLGSAFVTVQTQVYESLYSLVPSNFNPWAAPVAITGTDGLQVAPDMDDHEIVTVFSTDLSRSVTFNFGGDSED